MFGWLGRYRPLVLSSRVICSTIELRANGFSWRIRTSTKRTKISCATITPRRNKTSKRILNLCRVFVRLPRPTQTPAVTSTFPTLLTIVVLTSWAFGQLIYLDVDRDRLWQLSRIGLYTWYIRKKIVSFLLKLCYPLAKRHHLKPEAAKVASPRTRV